MGEKVLVAGKWSPLLSTFLLKIPGKNICHFCSIAHCDGQDDQKKLHLEQL